LTLVDHYLRHRGQTGREPQNFPLQQR